ncbi:hypothetical protein EJ06DRAFT_580622 [Trichodelitschia bisporula]|uniref:Mtf2-like C-terminal domain-containing protein n=1 Tax=Trichodelitschia bisporula TaxID=703511 RepID=A0A6G1I2Z9_9PEZI|nr:hypothetical protein EJ06DRAFT_580622 [Trichodelitschia bisporula]
MSQFAVPTRSTVLLPFLYHTRTILAPTASTRFYTRHTKPPQHATSAPFPETDDIPLETPVEDSSSPAAASTLTPQEQAAFAKLLSLQPTPTRPPSSSKPSPPQPDPAILSPTSLPNFPLSLRAMAETAAERAKLAADPARRARAARLKRVEDRLAAAKTDVELWGVLEREVFAPLGRMNAALRKDAKKEDEDAGEAEGKGAEARSKTAQAQAREVAVLGPNVAVVLVSAVRQLRTQFPGSPLVFNVLPAIKRLGNEAFVLGASTGLYNEMIAAVGSVYWDFERAGELVQEMVNAGMEFDEGTLAVLNRLERHGNRVLKGDRGDVRRAVWGTDGVQNGWRKLIDWKGVMEERVEAEKMRGLIGDADGSNGRVV